jgi:hypothetical protein
MLLHAFCNYNFNIKTTLAFLSNPNNPLTAFRIFIAKFKIESFETDNWLSRGKLTDKGNGE